MILRMPGRDNEESVNPFMKSKSISGNPKSIFAKIKNTFRKIKNQNDLSGNRFSNLENIFFVPKNRLAGNNLHENVNGLKFIGNILKIYGKILQKEQVNIIIPGNKLQRLGKILQKTGNKLKEKETHLKNLGSGMIFVEIFRENGESVLPFLSFTLNLRRSLGSAEWGTGKLGAGWRIAGTRFSRNLHR